MNFKKYLGLISMSLPKTSNKCSKCGEKWGSRAFEFELCVACKTKNHQDHRKKLESQMSPETQALREQYTIIDNLKVLEVKFPGKEIIKDILKEESLPSQWKK